MSWLSQCIKCHFSFKIKKNLDFWTRSFLSYKQCTIVNFDKVRRDYAFLLTSLRQTIKA